MMKYSKLFLAAVLARSTSVFVQGTGRHEYDFCGIYGANALDDNYTGTHPVAGLGCTLDDKTHCLCSIDYNRPSERSPFIWQCGGQVEFGPKGNKVCPDTVPVIKPTGVDSMDFTESPTLGVVVECDTKLHPSGYPGDELCGYSECESGGDSSAICACVDFTGLVDANRTGMQWICLHSKCNCPADVPVEDVGPISDSDKSNDSIFATALFLLLALFIVGARRGKESTLRKILGEPVVRSIASCHRKQKSTRVAS